MALSPLEISLVVLVFLLIFGAGRIPAIMQNLGKGISSFKRGLKDDAE
jgi:sec-independent protein translocase protein TatA